MFVEYRGVYPPRDLAQVLDQLPGLGEGLIEFAVGFGPTGAAACPAELQRQGDGALLKPRRAACVDPAALVVDGPQLEARQRDRDTVSVHVPPQRAVTNLLLRTDHPIDLVAVTAPGAVPVTVQVTGVRADTWPGEIRFRDVPAEGVDITVRAPGADRLRVTVLDESRNITEAPGFHSRPADTVASTREDGDPITVARTFTL
ncbi:hypothetical protein ACIG56_22035 [Nocardia fusca]|uniref:hypothetical protein n=1 Tax=Nocardia fusca TaxID=941183 RepID=UPI0037C9EDEB